MRAADLNWVSLNLLMRLSTAAIFASGVVAAITAFHASASFWLTFWPMARMPAASRPTIMYFVFIPLLLVIFLKASLLEGFGDTLKGRLPNGFRCFRYGEGCFIVFHGLVPVPLRISQTRQIQPAPSFGFGIRLQFQNLTEQAIARLGVSLQHSYPC